MTQFQKAVLATICLVACIASLTVLALAKVEGAPLAVVGIATAIVGFYTRETRAGEDVRKGEPKLPPGASLVPLFAAGIAVAALSGCAALAHDKELQAESAYRGQQLECVERHDTRETIEACRQKVREKWGIVETATKDGGR